MLQVKGLFLHLRLHSLLVPPLPEARAPDRTHVFRIAQLDNDDGRGTMRLEGKVVGPWVAELRDAVERNLSRSQSVVVDLSAMTFADAAGIDLLQELARRGVIFVNCSAFADAHLGEAACRPGME